MVAVALRQDGAGWTGADYINCPLTKINTSPSWKPSSTLIAASPYARRGIRDTPYFNGCLRSKSWRSARETLRHGPMKPFGLTNPHAGSAKPYAVVQLRQDNALGTLYNMVGFQTKLKHHAQVEIFRTIPGLKTPVSRASAESTAIPF